MGTYDKHHVHGASQARIKSNLTLGQLGIAMFVVRDQLTCGCRVSICLNCASPGGHTLECHASMQIEAELAIMLQKQHAPAKHLMPFAVAQYTMDTLARSEAKKVGLKLALRAQLTF